MLQTLGTTFDLSWNYKRKLLALVRTNHNTRMKCRSQSRLTYRAGPFQFQYGSEGFCLRVLLLRFVCM